MYDSVVKDVFCKKCHRLAAQIQRGKEEIKIIQGGKVLMSLGKGANISMNKLSVQCPSGHNVKVEV